MNKCYIPTGYQNPLTVYETQRAIEFIKRNFQSNLCHALNLKRVSAPLFVEESSGLNDNLNGYERPVSFDVPAVGAESQVVHSLAKWKRYALKRYNFYTGKGLVTGREKARWKSVTLRSVHRPKMPSGATGAMAESPWESRRSIVCRFPTGRPRSGSVFCITRFIIDVLAPFARG